MCDNTEKAQNKFAFSLIILLFIAMAFGAIAYQWVLHAEDLYLGLIPVALFVFGISFYYTVQKTIALCDSFIKEIDTED